MTRLPSGFASLFNLTGAPLTNALTQLDGEAATGAQKGAFEMMTSFLGLMLDPFVDGRTGILGGPAGFAPDEPQSFPPDVALATTIAAKHAGHMAIIYRFSPVGYGSFRTAVPVSSRDFRLEMIFGQPPETASINFEGSRSMV